MKRILIPLGIVIAVLLGTSYWMQSAENPDPNHTHADFAVWINGTKLDFSDERYMSAPPAETVSFIPKASAHGTENDGHVVPGREYLHLHDGNGSVVHRHKPGLTFGNFFDSIGLYMTDKCLMVDDFQYKKLDQQWLKDFNFTRNICDNGKFHWTMMVNGEVVPMNPKYEFQDLDKILLSYSASDTTAQEQYEELSDDACKYSKTCPWRGAPPTENCIADPTVPCVVQ